MTRPQAVPDGCELHAFDQIGSTSEEARRLAEAGAPDRTIVWAREQTAGRGRHGREWTSPPGNLYLSILFRPSCRVAEAPQIGFVLGVAMAGAIRDLTDVPVTLKWPNDLVHDGKKLSGILLDSADDGKGGVAWVVAGIGVNVDVIPEALSDAASLRSIGAEVEVETLLEAFLAKLMPLLDEWRKDGFAPVRFNWSAFAFDFGTPISVKLPDGAIEGRFEGIDAAGNLALRYDDRLHYVAAGDVFPVNHPATGES